jgi:hypothetical protein
MRMTYSKWLIRGLVLLLAGLLVSLAWFYQYWTNPSVVRQEVVDHLQALFPSSVISLESARLRLLGGIALNELRLTRRDDPSHTDFAYIPAARLYPDKERMLDGRLQLRKLELYRPRFRLVRAPDGRWNWEDLFHPAARPAVWPTLVIDDGTLLLVDQQAGATLPPLELAHVQLTVVADPADTIRLQGSGQSEVLGQVEVQGCWRRSQGELVVTFQVQRLQITPTLLRRLCPTEQGGELGRLELTASADLKGTCQYRSTGTPAWSYDVALELTQGKLAHPQLPAVLEELSLSARCRDGLLTLQRLTARAAAAQVQAEGEAQLPAPFDDCRGRLVLQHLPLTAELCQRLPGDLSKVYEALRPQGQVSAWLTWERRQGRWQQRHCRLVPEGASICYQHFPYPVQDICGRVDADLETGRTTVQVTGRASGQPVHLAGYWQGKGSAADVALELHAEQVPLDEVLLHALPTDALQQLARSFHARGRVNVQAQIRHYPGDNKFQNKYIANFQNAAIRWEGFPYPLEQIQGTLYITADHWECRDFTGRHGPARVYLRGQSLPAGAPHGPRLRLTIRGEQVPIDSDLRAALQPLPCLARAWDCFRPRGQLHFQAAIEQVPGQPQQVEVGVSVQKCAIYPIFFPYALEDLSGRFHYRGQHLQVQDVEARHGPCHLTLKEVQVDLAPGGSYFAVLDQLQVAPLVPDADLRAALPPVLRQGLETLRWEAPLTLTARRLVVAQDEALGSPPDLWWDAAARFTQARCQVGVDLTDVSGAVACIGRYNGRRLLGLVGNIELEQAQLLKQPLKGVHIHFYVEEKHPQVLVLDQMKAPFFGGDLSGQARIDFSGPVRYDLNLTASQIDLHRFGQHNFGPTTAWTGQAWGRLYLTGQGEDLNALEGNGILHVPQGKVYHLPFLEDLLKFLGLRTPDQTPFDEIHAEFSIHGRRLEIDHVDLWGNVLSLSGRGRLNLDGSDAALDFYPSWGPLEQLLPTTLRNLSPAVSKNMLKIEIRGRVGGRPEELHFTKKPLPVVVDPLLYLRDRLLRGPPPTPTQNP